MSPFNPALPPKHTTKSFTPGVGADKKGRSRCRISYNSREGQERLAWIIDQVQAGKTYVEIEELGKDKPWPVGSAVIKKARDELGLPSIRGPRPRIRLDASPAPLPQEGAPLPPRGPGRPPDRPAPLKLLVKQVHTMILRLGMSAITINDDGTVETHMDLDVI